MHEERIKKLYYTISEVSKMLGEEAHVLRYWETVFDALQPRKSRSGKRVYTEEDIEVVKRIQYLLRKDKYTIEGARQVMSRESNPQDQAPKDLEALKELRVFLEKLLETL